MGLISKDSGGGSDFEPLPAGTHVARCVSVVDLGIQETPRGPKEKVYLGFEVAGVRVEWEKDGQKFSGPAFIGSTYNNTINERAILGQHLTSWRGKPFTDEERQGFDLFNVLGAAAMISVTHNENNGKTYANINAIMRLPQGMTCPPAESEQIGYTPMDQNVAPSIDKLPDWLQKKVRAGYKIAEGSFVVGSAGGPMPAPQAAPQPQVQPPSVEQQLTPASMHPPQTAAEKMQAAMDQQNAPPPDDFDDDIPF